MDTKKIAEVKEIISASNKEIILNQTFLMINSFAELKEHIGCKLAKKYELFSQEFKAKIAPFENIDKNLKKYRETLAEFLSDSTSVEDPVPTLFKLFFPVFEELQEVHLEDELVSEVFDPTIFQDSQDISLALHNFLARLLINSNFSNL